MEAVVRATLDNFVHPILIGNKKKISAILPRELSEHGTLFEIVDCTDMAEAAALAVAMVKRGEADIVMKGLINTDLFLKAVLDKQHGIMKPEGVLSYVCGLEVPEL